MSRYDLTPKQAPFDSIVIGWDDLAGYYARGYYETALHDDESGEDWALEQEVDFAGDAFNGLLEPDELIDTIGPYAEIPTDLRNQLLADRDAGFCR